MNKLLNEITGALRTPRRLEVLTHPDPHLQQVCNDVDVLNDTELPALIKGLTQAMRANDGVGLAAPQTGEMKRLFIYDVSEDQDDVRVLINPVITRRSEELLTADEGCLSFPHIYFPVCRSSRISVEALDERGEQVVLEDVEGLLARVIQHECDHLDGVMIIERATPRIRKQALRAYATFDQQSEEFITIVDDQAEHQDDCG